MKSNSYRGMLKDDDDDDDDAEQPYPKRHQTMAQAVQKKVYL